MNINLYALGWDKELAAGYAPFDRPDCRPARVTRVDRGVCCLLAADGPASASLGGTLLGRAARDPLALPCTGDWVALRTWPDRRTTVEAVLPRRTRIVRATAGGQSQGQLLAANVDLAGVIEPMDPAPDAGRIERLLALAWASGAQPLVILTKADLVPRPDRVAAQVTDLAPGVPVLTVSARTGAGVARLRAMIGPGRTLGLLGRSGAGKSSLVNALAGTTVMATQAIRRADGRGRHTTTYRALIPLPDGGLVLDTPGLRGVGLQEDLGGLDLVFADIDELAAQCRYRDCGHGREPGCAVREALATGELSTRRLDSWLRLHRELAWQAGRRRAAARGRVR
jgi:ribosome biogenesis GTPase / thiamine phosphate phosphatase